MQKYEWNYSKKYKLVFKRCFAWFDFRKGWFHELVLCKFYPKDVSSNLNFKNLNPFPSHYTLVNLSTLG